MTQFAVRSEFSNDINQDFSAIKNKEKEMKNGFKTALAVVAVLGTLISAGCGSASAAGTATKNAGPQTVTFWHSMSGTNGQVLDKLIAKFNKTNKDKITVKALYQGAYDDAITKYKSAVQSKSTPTLMQVYDVGSRFMMDSGTVTPMQNFIDADNYDVSDLQPNVAGYYKVDGKLYSMPFNSSMPVIYYNKTMFRQAGLDPDKAPTTLAEVKADAEKLSQKNGGPAQYGFNAAVYGWFVEQEIAANGQLYCSPQNGRGSKRADDFTFNNSSATTFLTWWKGMIDSGISGNTGTDTDDADSAFESGKVGITFESTAGLSGIMAAAKTKGFEVGVGNYPKIKKNNSGPIIGGASLWISKLGHSSAQQEAAWKFIKFLSEPENQATWHTGTGYFPTSKKALNTETDKAWRKQYPQFDVAVKQLESTKLTAATQGCSAGVMPQARKAVEDGIEKVFAGADAKTALTSEVKGLQSDVQDYNSSVE
ncbi:glycerol-3-phosphate ABC transporter substrate-binding protein [Bifidobacterium aquikefiri]|uniref:Glycerol-3-phosphate ABC transporter substrate-binding protein n=2 Tax=Bifidobacterium aquikefiri TaxID=1653207 RepID=A0A261G501_9BIFI|nr:glycerol-3-phosphate ABC transporter substrate-binding protein [Bifidobacterium aquikefiri]